MYGHGQALGQDRLPHTGGVFDKEVAPGQEGDDGKGNSLGLAFYHPSDILP